MKILIHLFRYIFDKEYRLRQKEFSQFLQYRRRRKELQKFLQDAAEAGQQAGTRAHYTFLVRGHK